jgi:hypothetical protein
MGLKCLSLQRRVGHQSAGLRTGKPISHASTTVNKISRPTGLLTAAKVYFYWMVQVIQFQYLN